MTTSILVNGTGTLTPITLKKNYLNSIGTDSVLAYDAEQQVNPTSTGKVTNRYYYHTNQLGSIIAISTSTGLVVQKYTYNAYGKPYIYSGSTLTPLSNYTGTLYGNTRLYTGREYDRETGYYYLRARTYSPDLGRFLSRDPIGQNDQVNLYTYVANSPLKYVDRFGRQKALIFVGKDWGDAGPLGKLKKYQKQKYLDMGYKEENIIERYGSNIDDLVASMGENSYKDIAIVAHASKNSVELTHGGVGNQRIDKSTVSQLPTLSNKGVTLTIDGCMSGYGENPIAKKIAKEMDITVKAPDSILLANYPLLNGIPFIGTSSPPILENGGTYTMEDANNSFLKSGYFNYVLLQPTISALSSKPVNFITF